MKIIIYQNREVYKEESKIGNDSENKVETLEFEFPEEYKDFTKYIEFQTKDEKYVDLIEDDKYIITRAIAKYGKIKAQIVLRNSLENDVAVFKSDIFELKVSKSINATIDVPIEYPTWIDNLTRLKQDIEHAEHERVSNENERISAEKTRQENFTEMQKTVENATSNIKDLKEDYNENAKQKTEEFNKNFEEKQKAINDNAEAKTTAFGENAEAQTKTFNTNSDDKLAEYNRNHTAKMKEFDDNYDTKTKTFDDNAAAKLDEYNKNDKTKTDAYNNNASNKEETFNTNAADKQNEFDENASDKLAEYNQNAKELINKVEQVQAENETLKAENKLIKEQIPSASASGNSVHIEDSGTLDFDWKINGGHKQETRDGRQLFNKNDYVGIYQGYYDNGVLNKKDIRHNWIIMKYEKVNAELSYYYKNTTNGYNIVFTNLLPDEGVPVLADGSPYYYKTTSPDNSKYVMFYIGSEAENDWNFEERLNSLMVEETSERLTANDYEQYGASPSPDYPSKIETVKDSVKIDVVNKNLYNGKNEIGGINNDGSLNNNADRWRAIDYINVENSTDISINIYNITTTGALGKYCLYDKNYNFLSSTQIININTVVNVSNVSYFRFWFLNDKVPTNTKIQVETGSTPTTYAQQQSQTAIMPIQQEMLTGDYISSVEHHEWGKLVLTGNENFVQAQNANKLNYFYLNYNLIKIKGKIISNMLKSVKSGEIWNKTSYDDVVQVSDNKQTINIMLSDTTITTLQQFKEKLKELYNAGTPIIIYYELATPVNLELTVEQKSIRDTKLYTYKNITNIDISDELASIDVEYKKDQDTINKNYENRLAALEAASIS